ncbi:transcription factor subunit TAF6 [Cryptosporidium sp. chipmunk genotype I]|uniref:transcription factor subunit TAF6 n=1 Tax=Cryptosporidium sp. chipmunk genotype I TaxID=1280935 RepID=UPI00351A05E4|nr:transcription factor subunit TAF6 [Cryptosporidium sp. chipmunk genotype I]
MLRKTETSDYSQFSLNGSLDAGVYQTENNLILRKKQKKDVDEYNENGRSKDFIENTGIFSVYDFVYPLSKQICCDSISNHAASLIVQAVEFKLRQIIEEAIKLAYHRGSCNSGNLKENTQLPFISLGDINSAMRYICGSKHLIWSLEKLPRSYFISKSQNENNDQVIVETNAEVFYNLPERSIRYIPCFSFPDKNESITSTLKTIKRDNNKEILHNIIKDLDGKNIEKLTIHLHWLAVEGKFVFNSENDTKFIKNIYNNIEENSKFIKGEMNFDVNFSENYDNFKVVINKAVEGFLSEEQREFLSYMNRIFLRGMEELYSSCNLPLNLLNSNIEQRALIINNFANTYGLSEKDTDTLSSVFSVIEGLNSSNLLKSAQNQYIDCFNRHDSCIENNKIHSKEFRQKIELLQKLNDIFHIVETNTDFEPLLPYLVYYFNYNTKVICTQFEKKGEFPKLGTLRLLLRICRSIIRNPHCSKTTYYIHKIIESLIRIMVSCPIKEVLSNSNLKVSELFLVDNLNARLDASVLLENILENCSHHLPIGTAKVLEYLSSEFKKLLDIRISNLMNGNCLQIASLYGVVCGIRSLGDFSVSSVLFPKLLTLFSYYLEDHNSKISFLRLHLEISTLINKYIALFQVKFELLSHYNSIDLIFLYLEKLIESLERILGDGAIPILLKSAVLNHYWNSDQITQAICLLDQCIKSHYIDSNIKCQNSKGFLYITNKKHLSNQYIKKFVDSYNYKDELVSRRDFCLGSSDSDFYSLNSILNISI